jgi:hypothetical protein
MAFESISRIESSQRTTAVSGSDRRQRGWPLASPPIPTAEPRPEQENERLDDCDFSALDPVICAILALLNPAACAQVAGEVKKVLSA